MNINLLKLIIFYNLINFILNQVCGPSNPENATYCFNSSYVDNSCCFTSVTYNLNSAVNDSTVLLNYDAQYCLLVPNNITFITPFITNLDFGLPSKVQVSIKCLQPSNYNPNDYECGKPDPQTLSDCSVSDIENQKTCCLFKNGNNKKCILNNGTSSDNLLIFGVSLECKAQYNSINNLLLLILYFIL